MAHPVLRQHDETEHFIVGRPRDKGIGKLSIPEPADDDTSSFRNKEFCFHKLDFKTEFDVAAARAETSHRSQRAKISYQNDHDYYSQ